MSRLDTIHRILALDRSDPKSQRISRTIWPTVVDLVVVGCLLGQGILALCLSRRSDDFFTGDTTYFELARSWLDTGSYGFNGKVESLFPPGFPAILALLCITIGCHYAVMIRAMAVFATLGLLVSYAVLRRLHGRSVAAVCCLLLASSTEIFALATRMVFSDLPYFFTSLLTLVVATHVEAATSPRMRFTLGLLCAFLVVVSLLLRSAAVALLVGLLVWLAVSCCTDWHTARRRLILFLPTVLLGLVVQGWWMHWSKQHEVLEWQLPGFPMSYIAQLRVKDGYQPELGTASLSDIPARVGRNLVQRSVGLMTLLTHKKYIDPALFSVAVCGPVGLILIGLGYSLWRRGGQWTDWYFLSYEAMYLLWPWTLEQLRFLIPVAPLAGLYLWRGGAALFRWTYHTPRLVGAVSFPLLVFLGVSATILGWESASLQLKLSAVLWWGMAIVAARLAWIGSAPLSTMLSWCLSLLKGRVSVWGTTLTGAEVGGVVLVITLSVVGLVQQIHLGRANLVFDVTQQPSYPDIEAAQWIQFHTAPAAVVMARQVDVVYHYSRRKVVWFPPLSNPQVLMEGIRKYKVAFLIVSDRQHSYWIPPEQECFRSLLAAYPEVFHLVHEGPHERIFAVVAEAHTAS